MKNIKKLIASALLAVFIGLQSAHVYADGSVGDPNIDNGGGGLQSGTSSNFWYQTDDGVRVTIVDAKTGEEKSQSMSSILCTFAADSSSLISSLRACCSGVPLFLLAILKPPK